MNSNYYTNNRGYVFPLVILSLLIFSAIGLMLALKFAGTGSKEFVKTQSVPPNYALTQAGIERAKYELKRPDDPAQAHTWTSGYSDSFTIIIDGEEVSITVEDMQTGN